MVAGEGPLPAPAETREGVEDPLPASENPLLELGKLTELDRYLHEVPAGAYECRNIF